MSTVVKKFQEALNFNIDYKVYPFSFLKEKWFVSLSSSPMEEETVQVSTARPYMEEMTKESRRYLEYLTCFFEKALNPKFKRFFSFNIIRQKHDFGYYDEVYFSIDYAAIEKEMELTEEVKSILENTIEFVEKYAPATWQDTFVSIIVDMESNFDKLEQQDIFNQYVLQQEKDPDNHYFLLMQHRFITLNKSILPHFREE